MMPHYYNYELMKHINDGKQMTDVWRLPAIAPWEKLDGQKHPTQKPLSLLTRIILSSAPANAWILDPFAGSSTTGIAANLCGCRFLGIEQDKAFAELSVERRRRLEEPQALKFQRRHLPDLIAAENFWALQSKGVGEEVWDELPF